MDILEGVMRLEKSPFVCVLVNGTLSSDSREHTPPSNDKNLPTEYKPSPKGAW